MIQEIQLAISKMIKDTAIQPNTIRIHPADTAKLKSYASYSYGLQDGRIITIFGLRVIETTKVKEGEVEIYNDKTTDKTPNTNLVDNSNLLVVPCLSSNILTIEDLYNFRADVKIKMLHLDYVKQAIEDIDNKLCTQMFQDDETYDEFIEWFKQRMGKELCE